MPQAAINAEYGESLNFIRQSMGEMQGRFERQDETIKKILTALVGNDLMTNGGIVNDIKDIKTNDLIMNDRLKALEEFKNRFYWTAAILSCIFTMVGGIITFIFMYLNYSKR